MSGFFEKFIFGLKAFSFSIRMGLSLTKLLMSPQKKVVSSAKFTILIFRSPVCTTWIPCHYLWNGWRPWLQQHTKTRRAGSIQNYLHDKGKVVREETIYFYFHIEYCSVRFISGRWNCYGNRGMEVQKVPGNFVKSFSRVLLSLLETSIVSLRNCIIWILSLIIVNYWIYSFWHEISKYFKIKSPF